ncbi:MAG: iron-sulfur cluster assembly scaffold protein [Thiolinea sp.]
MSQELYQQAIKELARAAHGAGALAAAQGSAKLDNPLCGDRVHLEVELSTGRIRALGHQTRGCLLCRAAASVLGLHAAGHTRQQLAALQAELGQWLQAETAAPPADWPELAVFQPVQAFPSRHGCVLLPFQAVLAALDSLDKDAP